MDHGINNRCLVVVLGANKMTPDLERWCKAIPELQFIKKMGNASLEDRIFVLEQAVDMCITDIQRLKRK